LRNSTALSSRVSAAHSDFFGSRRHCSVTIHDNELGFLTPAAVEITIPASAATLEQFVDDLANHVEPNFVSIAQTKN
jgi:hypothetical protein